MSSSAVEIGGSMPGTATVGLPTGLWDTDHLAIGAQMTGTLNIERGRMCVRAVRL
jgi:hypothetical protein